MAYRRHSAGVLRGKMFVTLGVIVGNHVEKPSYRKGPGSHNIAANILRNRLL